MDTFSEALVSGKTGKIPEAYDWFAPLIGDWDCDYYDKPEEGRKRHVAGEWIFRRILEGTGMRDLRKTDRLNRIRQRKDRVNDGTAKDQPGRCQGAVGIYHGASRG